MSSDAAKAEAFFKECEEEALSEDQVKTLRDFIARHYSEGSRVVVLTSGGTLVPLERNMVRFLDNFSGGRRGAATCEALLKQGCAVVFCHRKHSLEPFVRTLPTGTSLLAMLADSESDTVPPAVLDVARSFKEVSPRLLQLTFNTVGSYMHLLREATLAVAPLGQQAMVLLAAAVSDFYVPKTRIAQHKIQTAAHATLDLSLDPVPKVLGLLCQEWCPKAYVVSFKLETDPAILESKALGALERYGHQGVIANLLSTRHKEVIFYPGGETIRCPDDSDDLEPALVSALLRRWTEEVDRT